MRITRAYCTRCKKDVAAGKSLGRQPRCAECGSRAVRGTRKGLWKAADKLGGQDR